MFVRLDDVLGGVWRPCGNGPAMKPFVHLNKSRHFPLKRKNMSMILMLMSVDVLCAPSESHRHSSNPHSHMRGLIFTYDVHKSDNWYLKPAISKKTTQLRLWHYDSRTVVWNTWVRVNNWVIQSVVTSNLAGFIRNDLHQCGVRRRRRNDIVDFVRLTRVLGLPNVTTYKCYDVIHGASQLAGKIEQVLNCFWSKTLASERCLKEKLKPHTHCGCLESNLNLRVGCILLLIHDTGISHHDSHGEKNDLDIDPVYSACISFVFLTKLVWWIGNCPGILDVGMYITSWLPWRKFNLDLDVDLV